MKKYLFYVLISCLALSCTSPEKEAEVIMKQFTNSLNSIKDVPNISAQDLSKEIKICLDDVNKLITNKRKEFTKPEEKERFNNIISINDNEIYLALRQELANKNLQSLENIKNKKWINSESQSASSIFTLDETCISFLNLKNKFSYALENGDIIFNNDGGINPLYFTIEGDELIITNGQGQTSKFREATFADIIQAKWINPQNNVFGFILKKDGKGTSFGINNENFTYTIKDKNITTVTKKKYFNDDICHYKYLSNDKLKYTDYGTYGAEFVRRREIGPDCLTFLFDEKVKSDVKIKTTFSTTSKSDNDWDSILDSYESFVNKYIKLLKKAQNGDTSAMTEYVECLEKAQKLQSQLENAKSDLTTKQVNRLTKIISKLSNAATSAF